MQSYQFKVLRLTEDAPWLVINKTLPKELQQPTVDQYILYSRFHSKLHGQINNMGMAD